MSESETPDLPIDGYADPDDPMTVPDIEDKLEDGHPYSEDELVEVLNYEQSDGQNRVGAVEALEDAIERTQAGPQVPTHSEGGDGPDPSSLPAGAADDAASADASAEMVEEIDAEDEVNRPDPDAEPDAPEDVSTPEVEPSEVDPSSTPGGSDVDARTHPAASPSAVERQGDSVDVIHAARQGRADPAAGVGADVAPTPRTATVSELVAPDYDLPHPYEPNAPSKVRIVVPEPMHFGGVQFESRGVYDIDYAKNIRVLQALDSPNNPVTLHKSDPFAADEEEVRDRRRAESTRRIAGVTDDRDSVRTEQDPSSGIGSPSNSR